MKHIRNLALIGTALASLTVFSVTASARTLDVVTSFTVLGDVVQQVGGNHVKVKTLVGPDGDPHEFEPSPADARSLRAADIAFVSGEGLEGWMDRLIKASGYKRTPIVASEGVKTRTMDEDGKMVTDPHVWNSPVNVLVWVDNIEKALIAADAEDATTFKANADNYRKKLQALNSYAHSKLDAVPETKRKILTSHDAFGYFGREYKVTFLSPLGVSTETEASAADVGKLINQIKSEGVKAYFIENSNDPKLVKQIAAATGAKPGGELYVEALSKEGGPASTYEKMFRYNVDQVVAALSK